MRYFSRTKISILLCVLSSLFITSQVFASDSETAFDNILHIDRVRLIAQQTSLLKNRLAQAQNEVKNLQNQQNVQLTEITPNQSSKQIRNQLELDIAVAKSNLDSVNIELTESQQSVSRLEKDIQEIENQLNSISIFGLKIARNDDPNMSSSLKSELTYLNNLLELEKNRTDNLNELQKLADTVLQLQKSKYTRVVALLKSQTIMRLKEQQAKSEIDFEQQQSFWLQRLNVLYAELNKDEKNSVTYKELQEEIFYANENVNYTYLQMLIVRYQDQLRQLRVSISRTGSIGILNKASEQVQTLIKQFARVKELLNTRITILDRRAAFLQQHPEERNDISKITKLTAQYQAAIKNVDRLNKKIMVFRGTLDQALQYEISSRQGLPGFSAKAWLDLGEEILLIPTLGFQVIKSLGTHFVNGMKNLTSNMMWVIGFLELVWLTWALVAYRGLAKLAKKMPEHEEGHVNLKRLCVQLLKKNMLEIALIGNVIGLFALLGIPTQNSAFLVNLALVWLFFKVVINMARLCLVETAHDKNGHDVRLYHRLKWAFLVGGVITALTVFMHQLPVIYEVQDLFERFFLCFMLVVSVFLLKSWEIVPGLILPHMDNRRPYLKKVVLMLGLLIPLILLVNSAVGLFGYVNLVLTITWYESIFLLIMVGYLILRGLLIEGMMFVSTLFIRHSVNGWLWTEAVLKPLDKVLRIGLFLTAWACLFLSYGWDKQSPVVERLDKLLNYQVANVLNTSITPLSILELMVVSSLLFWMARWTREFVYRLLITRTQDNGLRNSIAIISQYAMILLGVLIGLRVLGIDFKALGVVAATFAIGISFGLRDLANNFVCGFLLLIERPVRVGDTVTIGTYEGEVIHIGGRAVTVRTWDHMDVLVPNAEIFSKSFTNWTAKDHIVRTIIAIKINRHDSPHDVQALIYEALGTHPQVLVDPVAEVLLKEISDSLIEFEVRYYINLRQVKSRIAVRSEVLMAIWDTFQANGIKPPYPQQEIHVQNNVQALPSRSVIPAQAGIHSE